MINVRIDTPVEISRIKLLRLGKDLAAACKMILATIATAAKNRVKKRMGAYLGPGSGWLKKHVYGIRRSEKHYVVAAPRHVAEILERGGTIRPRKRQFLAFRGADGQFVRTKLVTIAPRRWFTRAYDGFENSPEYTTAVDKGVDKAIRKYGESAVWRI